MAAAVGEAMSDDLVPLLNIFSLRRVIPYHATRFGSRRMTGL